MNKDIELRKYVLLGIVFILNLSMLALVLLGSLDIDAAIMIGIFAIINCSIIGYVSILISQTYKREESCQKEQSKIDKDAKNLSEAAVLHFTGEEGLKEYRNVLADNDICKKCGKPRHKHSEEYNDY